MPAGWQHTHAGVVREALRRRRSLRHWQISRQVRTAFELPPLPPIRSGDEVWAILLVKNEVDILPYTLRHILNQDVDRILVVDNGSTDGTVEVIRDMMDSRHPIHLGFDHEPAYYQSEKMTYLARWASARGASWIVPTDADEFWFAAETSVGTFLRSTPDDIIEATLHNVFPTQDNPQLSGLHGPLRFDLTPHKLGKVALRGHPLAWLGMGNHVGKRPGRTGVGLFIAHLPWRSEAQFVRKTRQGAAALSATDIPDGFGEHWRKQDAMDDSARHHRWLLILEGIAVDEPGWNPVGPFVLTDPSKWNRWPDAFPRAKEEQFGD